MEFCLQLASKSPCSFPSALQAHHISPTSCSLCQLTKYDDHINLTKLRTSSKVSFICLLPPAHPFHLAGRSSPYQARLQGHLSLPISPAATRWANSLFLNTSYLVRNSSPCTGHRLRDDLDPSQLHCLAIHFLSTHGLPLGRLSLPFSPAATCLTASLISSTATGTATFPLRASCHLRTPYFLNPPAATRQTTSFPSHQLPTEQLHWNSCLFLLR